MTHTTMNIYSVFAPPPLIFRKIYNIAHVMVLPVAGLPPFCENHENNNWLPTALAHISGEG